VLLHNSEATLAMLHQLRGLGVRVSMDDFGTGYSSLGYLRKAEFDMLKIDRSFVQAISDDDPESTAIIRAVVALALELAGSTIVFDPCVTTRICFQVNRLPDGVTR
jgi:EAL domain-containing protein (putative c-di-GMP-specific phosphodiesterase class I)